MLAHFVLQLLQAGLVVLAVRAADDCAVVDLFGGCLFQQLLNALLQQVELVGDLGDLLGQIYLHLVVLQQLQHLVVYSSHHQLHLVAAALAPFL